ncbi:hypothetical protein TeGR_g11743 [Tetraparma gracilis]|uniref:Tudor domain-containing protein n=1 Tax=Tetraparma gracilis TaxID=2962635 RepID=A0ABQ6MMY2_9STRA|nr:hypothetical protein TeGR_g11743 [Tetraparma gracilis]
MPIPRTISPDPPAPAVGTTAAASTVAASTIFKEGQQVMAQWQGNGYFPGKIEKVLGGGEYDITFDDNDAAKVAAKGILAVDSGSLVGKKNSFKKGQRVMAQFKNRLYYHGTIVTVLDGDEYGVSFDDGDAEKVAAKGIVAVDSGSLLGKRKEQPKKKPASGVAERCKKCGACKSRKGKVCEKWSSAEVRAYEKLQKQRAAGKGQPAGHAGGKKRAAMQMEGKGPKKRPAKKKLSPTDDDLIRAQFEAILKKGDPREIKPLASMLEFMRPSVPAQPAAPEEQSDDEDRSVGGSEEEEGGYAGEDTGGFGGGDISDNDGEREAQQDVAGKKQTGGRELPESEHATPRDSPRWNTLNDILLETDGVMPSTLPSTYKLWFRPRLGASPEVRGNLDFSRVEWRDDGDYNVHVIENRGLGSLQDRWGGEAKDFKLGVGEKCDAEPPWPVGNRPSPEPNTDPHVNEVNLADSDSEDLEELETVTFLDARFASEDANAELEVKVEWANDEVEWTLLSALKKTQVDLAQFKDVVDKLDALVKERTPALQSSEFTGVVVYTFCAAGGGWSWGMLENGGAEAAICIDCDPVANTINKHNLDRMSLKGQATIIEKLIKCDNADKKYFKDHIQTFREKNPDKYVMVQASPSCKDLSSMNTHKKPGAEEKSVGDIAWYHDFFTELKADGVADGWLIENVTHPALTAHLDRMKAAGKIFGSYACDFADRGNPSTRLRQIISSNPFFAYEWLKRPRFNRMPAGLPGFEGYTQAAEISRQNNPQNSKYRPLDEIAYTVTTVPLGISPNGPNDSRRDTLTVDQLKVLNGFPPNFTFPDNVSDRDKYAAIGNAIPPSVVKDLFDCSKGNAVISKKENRDEEEGGGGGGGVGGRGENKSDDDGEATESDHDGDGGGEGRGEAADGDDDDDDDEEEEEEEDDDAPKIQDKEAEIVDLAGSSSESEMSDGGSDEEAWAARSKRAWAAAAPWAPSAPPREKAAAAARARADAGERERAGEQERARTAAAYAGGAAPRAVDAWLPGL